MTSSWLILGLLGIMLAIQGLAYVNAACIPGQAPEVQDRMVKRSNRAFTGAFWILAAAYAGSIVLKLL